MNDEKKDKASIKSGYGSLRHIAKYLSNYKLGLLGVLISLIFTSSCVLLIGKVIQYLIDSGFDDTALLDRALMGLIAVAVLLAIATFSRASLIYVICERVVADIRTDVYKHIIRLSPSFFEINKTSDILSRLTNDTTLLNSVIANVVSVALRNILLAVGATVMLVVTSIKLTMYVMVIVPLVIVPILYMGRKVKALSRLTQDKVGDLSAHIEESLNGIKTVQSYVREHHEITVFDMKEEAVLTANIDRVYYRAILVALVISSIFIAISSVLWVGGYDVISGKLSGGSLSSFLFYAIILSSSLGALSEVYSDLQRAIGASERLFELLSAKSDIRDPKEPEEPNLKDTSIIFKDVEFYYPTRKDSPALSEFNLQIRSGEKIAIVGPSGAGKTSVFQALLRFYDCSKGEIKIGGINIKNLRLKDLRSQFGVVSQDSIIFSDSAYENIRYGKPTATEKEIIEAAKKAEIFDFLGSLPNGIHTFLGEKGVRISGGQAQRIAIARAILKDPQILLLDEATSALDSENEEKVQKALAVLMDGKTTIIIAHRISTIKNTDRIIVMDNAKILEEGNHASLVKKSGLYARLSKEMIVEEKN